MWKIITKKKYNEPVKEMEERSGATFTCTN